jgi:UDP-N-acetylmuramate-alanine ligase
MFFKSCWSLNLLQLQSLKLAVVLYRSYKRDTWLGKLTEGYELIAVAGTHGNLTSS